MPKQSGKKKVSIQEVCVVLCEYCAEGNEPEQMSGYTGYTHRYAPSWEDKAYCTATPIREKFAD